MMHHTKQSIVIQVFKINLFLQLAYPLIIRISAFLQNKIKTQASLKKNLYLPAGRYLISDEIIRPSNISKEGAGDNTEIIH